MANAACRAYVPRCYSLKNSVNTVPYPPSSLRRTAKFPYVSGTRAIPPLNGDQIDRGSRYKNLFDAKCYASSIRVLKERGKKEKFEANAISIRIYRKTEHEWTIALYFFATFVKPDDQR